MVPADPRLVAVCEELEADLVGVCAGIAAELVAAEPLYGTTMTQAELAAAVQRNVAGLLAGVRAAEVRDLGAARDTGRRRAAQGIPLPVVLSGYRRGVMHLWDLLVRGCAAHDRACGDAGGGAGQALLGSASVLWVSYDTHAHEVATAYEAQQSERLRHDHARRQGLVAALLAGEATPELPLAEVARRLDVPVTGPYLVLVADGAPQHRARVRAPSGPPVLWRPGPVTDVGLLWLPTAGDADRAVDRVRALGLGRVGVSRVFDALAQAPRAVEQARLARDAGAVGPQVVTTFVEVEVAALVTGTPEVAAALRSRVLGGLDRLDAPDREALLATARTWLAHGASAQRTGGVLHCHPNTVRYRLNRLRTLTGRRWDDPVDLVELHLALEADRLL